jgi:hypothetical protein
MPDRLLRRMLDVVDQARQSDTDEVPPRCLVAGLAELVPAVRCGSPSSTYLPGGI